MAFPRWRFALYECFQYYLLILLLLRRMELSISIHPVDVRQFVVSVADFHHQPRVSVDVERSFEFLSAKLGATLVAKEAELAPVVFSCSKRRGLIENFDSEIMKKMKKALRGDANTARWL